MTRQTTTRRAGFTLTEIMIALGVLVVGMGMAAGALHAGIQTHINTVDDIVRTMVGENALAIAKARLRHGQVSLTDSYTMVDDLQIGREDKTYPVGRPTTVGYIMYAKRSTGDTDNNDYRFLVIPYRGKMGNYIGSDMVKRASVSAISSDPGSPSRIVIRSSADRKKMQVGGKVVEFDNNGNLIIATIVEQQGSKTYNLDKALPSGNRDVTVLAVYDQNDQLVDLEADPKATPEFMEPYSARTALPSN